MIIRDKIIGLTLIICSYFYYNYLKKNLLKGFLRGSYNFGAYLSLLGMLIIGLILLLRFAHF